MKLASLLDYQTHQYGGNRHVRKSPNAADFVTLHLTRPNKSKPGKHIPFSGRLLRRAPHFLNHPGLIENIWPEGGELPGNPIDFALRHPITTMMLVMALVGGGFLALNRMCIDIFPP